MLVFHPVITLPLWLLQEVRCQHISDSYRLTSCLPVEVRAIALCQRCLMVSVLLHWESRGNNCPGGVIKKWILTVKFFAAQISNFFKYILCRSSFFCLTSCCFLKPPTPFGKDNELCQEAQRDCSFLLPHTPCSKSKLLPSSPFHYNQQQSVPYSLLLSRTCPQRQSILQLITYNSKLHPRKKKFSL